MEPLGNEGSHAKTMERLASVSHAPEEIVARFASRLAAFAAGKMSERLQRRVGPDDIVQSVFATFFRRLDDERLQIRDWDSLWGLLAQITVCRICRHAERNQAAKRNQDLEVGIETATQPLDREPRPEEAAMTAELCEKLLAGLPENYRPIVELILHGATHEAIVGECGVSLSTVERVHRRAKDRLRELLQRDEGR